MLRYTCTACHEVLMHLFRLNAMIFASTVKYYVPCEEYNKDIIHSVLSSSASQVNPVLHIS
jgi:hypothetical protein